MKFTLSKKRIVFALLLATVTVLGGLHFGSSVKFILAATLLFLLGGVCSVKLHRLGYILYLLSMPAAAALTAVMMQKANDVTLFMTVEKLLLNVGLALLLVAFACLIQALITRKLSPAAMIAACALLMIMALANYFVYAFRGNGLSPADLLYMGTAVNFVANYEYVVPRFMFHALMLWLGGAFFISGIDFGCVRSRVRGCAAPLAVLVLLCVLLSKPVLSDAIRSNHYGNNGCAINGLLLNFALETKESIIIRPRGYSAAEAEKAGEKYAVPVEAEAVSGPNIIVIMNEAFSDLRAIGETDTSLPLMPVLDSLTENTVKGFALSSTFGGMTANSEYEFLTGNSMAFLPSFSVPFQQYVPGPAYTLERHLASLGYSSFATHPCEKENWSRYKVWPYLGFEDNSYVEAFAEAEKYAGRIADSSLYDYIIERYDSMGSGKKFIYTVSIQNHSPFDGVPEQDITVTDNSYDSHVVNAYHSLIRESDRAFGQLVAHFEKLEEPVIILMYGDHQAALPDAYLEQLHGGSFDSLDEQMLKYKLPFVIWANYDIEEKTVPLTSLNYLSCWLLDAAGLPQPAYNNFLLELRGKIPAMNSQGYWSESRQCFLETEDAVGEEKALLEQYWRLQYNAMFDRDRCSEKLFPIE